MTPAQIVSSIRRAATARMKAHVAPYLHSSGFVDETSADGHLQLVVLKRTRKIRNPISPAMEDGFYGFTDYGLITDGYGGGLVTLAYEQIAVEDIIKLERLVCQLQRHQFKC